MKALKNIALTTLLTLIASTSSHCQPLQPVASTTADFWSGRFSASVR